MSRYDDWLAAPYENQPEPEIVDCHGCGREVYLDGREDRIGCDTYCESCYRKVSCSCCGGYVPAALSGVALDATDDEMCPFNDEALCLADLDRLTEETKEIVR